MWDFTAFGRCGCLHSKTVSRIEHLYQRGKGKAVWSLRRSTLFLWGSWDSGPLRAQDCKCPAHRAPRALIRQDSCGRRDRGNHGNRRRERERSCLPDTRNWRHETAKAPIWITNIAASCWRGGQTSCEVDEKQVGGGKHAFKLESLNTLMSIASLH